MDKKGFTLIELMIVVAIIGILSAIALPRFADLLRRSNEGATRGSLSSLRSALSIYYAEQEGLYPNVATGTGGAFAAVMAPRYIKRMPMCNVALPGIAPSSVVNVVGAGHAPAVGTARWGYNVVASTVGTVGRLVGDIWVDNSAVDSRGVVWYTH